jgi:signal transduction histidine kinase
MKEAVRLIRLSLIVQLALAAFAIASDVIASGFSLTTSSGNMDVMLRLRGASDLTRALIAIDLLGTLPVIALFVATLLPRTMATQRGVQAVLVLMIAAFTWQISAPVVVVTRLATTNPSIGKPLHEIVVGGASPASLAAGPISELLLFALLPAVIGAWLGGKRSAAAWTLIANVFIVSSAIIVWWVTPTELMGDERVADAIVLLLGQCLVIGMMCYFVGALADRLRDERVQVEQANARLAEANQQLAQQAYVREQLAASRERMQLSRDLHDTLAHTLAGLTVQLDAVSAIVKPDDVVVKAELARASELAHDGLDTARNAITGLRADAVSELGLSGAIRRRMKVVERRADVQAELQIEGGEPVIDNAAALSLYGIAQEALNNVERHANAQHVRVVLTPHSLTICDDGVGFDGIGPEAGRYGLRGMRERAAAMGAWLTVHSRAGDGTTIEVQW